jgi:hypothetical protein
LKEGEEDYGYIQIIHKEPDRDLVTSADLLTQY